MNIKPLSVNKAWKGRRFRTDEYKAYKQHLLLILPKLNIPDKTPLSLSIEWGFSDVRSDIDNPVKTTVDIFQAKYGFNDRYIEELNLKKKIVEKGEEYIKFSIEEITDGK